MNRERKWSAFWALALAVFVSLASLLLHGGPKAPRQTLLVSIPDLHVSGKERVVGFEVHVVSGRIAALPNIPIGWNMSIDNNPSWTTEIVASVKVGAAAVDPGFFREFLLIEKDESLGVPFQMSGEVVVTEDFATERRISIGTKDFDIKESAAQNLGGCK